jgi:mono/diheme cytochrome c family protein
MSRSFTRYRVRVAIPCLVAGLGLVAATAAVADDSAFTSKAGLDAQSGAAIYSNICQGCHMPQAQGAVGAGHYPALAGDPKLISWEYVALTVLGGRERSRGNPRRASFGRAGCRGRELCPPAFR